MLSTPQHLQHINPLGQLLLLLGHKSCVHGMYVRLKDCCAGSASAHASGLSYRIYMSAVQACAQRNRSWLHAQVMAAVPSSVCCIVLRVSSFKDNASKLTTDRCHRPLHWAWMALYIHVCDGRSLTRVLQLHPSLEPQDPACHVLRLSVISFVSFRQRLLLGNL
jgi:hypothetical protein